MPIYINYRQLLGIVLAGVLLGGCQRSVNVPVGTVSQTPMETDEAMQIRDWERSVAYYQNPRFIAGPTGFWYETPYYPPQWWYAASDTALFALQTLGLPVTLIVQPPWTAVEYAGETVEPTFHGMPPMPPSSVSAAQAPTEPEAPVMPEPPAEPQTPPDPAPPPG
jgi:hypothetical protein